MAAAAVAAAYTYNQNHTHTAIDAAPFSEGLPSAPYTASHIATPQSAYINHTRPHSQPLHRDILTHTHTGARPPLHSSLSLLCPYPTLRCCSGSVTHRSVSLAAT